MSKTWIAGFTALTALATVGCGGALDEPVIVPVEGIITLHGKPLEGATLSFVPDGTNSASTPGADLSGPDGSFRARYRNRPGLAPGKYKVLVAKDVTDAKKAIPEALQNDPHMAKMAGLLKSEAPSRYSDLKNTPLSLEVSPQGEKGLSFDLKGSLK